MILNDTFRACVAHPGIVSVASTSKETGAHIANTWNKYLIITVIMARLSRQKSDDFIVNQAAAFAASSNMAGKYASAGGMSPIAEWQRS